MNQHTNPAFWRYGRIGLLMLAVVAALILIGLAVQGRQREQRTIARIMTAQGESLIRVVEAGRRMGQRGPEGRAFRINFLMDEMMRQGDLLFLAILDSEGRVEAMSEAEPGTGATADVLAGLTASPDAAWTLVPAGTEQAFAVYRHSRPPRRPMHGHWTMHSPPDEDRVTIVVGLEATAYLRAARKDVLTLAMASGLGLTLFFAGSASVFWRRKVATLEKEVAKQERLAALGTLAAGVAHEIRNPLSSIKGFATYFREKFPAGTSDRDLAEVMIGETERLNRVVSELLELTHPSDLRRERRSMSELVRHALKLVEADCRKQGISVTTSLQDVSLVMDFDRMLQAVLNVLLNAIQAMPTGGRLHVSAVRVRDQLEVQIGDSGPGILSENLQKIFDPYFTTKNQGTGLGLPTVRKIIEAHGGQVRIESEPGTGTRVYIQVPIREDK